MEKGTVRMGGEEMPHGYEQFAECPRCKEKAHGEEEITRLFGYRTMENGNVIPQSHCKKCRIEEAKGDK